MPKQPVATRLREQHRLTVDFGTAALRATSVAALLEEACRVAAKGLSVKLAKHFGLTRTPRRSSSRLPWGGRKVSAIR
ncbi:hypothetical protein [Caballeronia glathei]|jgi:hypothetical protein|uniref:hypothetical protein n=1 Tax=Caballeronia glathei TaxID=60547 RepID=UPI00068E350A|nr:hypothetical protein [Caballeronia glathei]